jgi:subtilase-type serine protease
MKQVNFRRALLGATTAAVALCAASAAQADAGSATIQGAAEAPFANSPPSGVEDLPAVVVRNDLNPNAPPPAGVLDSGINGVGQMTIRNSPSSTSMGLCTGTLINPRTVIFAAHCVYSRPAEAYGTNGVAFGAHAGGTPIAFGFNADNLPAVRQWLGLDGGAAGQTNLAKALYAVEQVWYDPRSLGPNGFVAADIAIATLDTPAFGIPTWAMLFSPLTEATHSTITGYGNRGNENSTALAIDWRRRSAENMISVLGSMDDRNKWIFGSGAAVNSLYMQSFSDPNPAYNPSAGKFDFGIFGDTALPREGTTAGGDSGGPLIVDQKYDRPVVAGVLSGGSRFFGAQQFHNYGTHDFYQPLFAYWDVIVANNPYVYAGNIGGNGNWEDADHWVQLMDPSYFIDVNGQLVNALPDTPAIGTAAGGTKFGQICFLSDCTNLSAISNPPVGDGTSVFIEGGPGSRNFVPNNVVGNPSAGIRSRYYDVTLSAAGSTTLGSAVTIDRMTLDGPTKLHVKQSGSLSVLGEYNQLQGWTNVDGAIKSGRDMMVLSGLLSGSGTIDTQFLTVVAGVVAPGTITPSGARTVGTLTVEGNVILSSASTLMIKVGRGNADTLSVSDVLALGGGTIWFGPAQGAAVRHGQSFTVATAGIGVDGTFGHAVSSLGVLNPHLSYTGNTVSVSLQAGSLAQHAATTNTTALAFGNALDALRTTSYSQLSGLYGSIDLMGSTQLAATLQGLAPNINEARSLHDRQNKIMLSAVTQRLSGLGDREGGLSVSGSPSSFAQPDHRAGLAALVPSTPSQGRLPKGFTGFVTGGLNAGQAGLHDHSGQHTNNVGMGLELEVARGVTLGSAFGYAKSSSIPGADRSKSEIKTAQTAIYGSYQLGGGAYVGGVAAAENSRAWTARFAMTGDAAFDLTGATSASRYNLVAEAGVNINIAHGLTLTPRAQLDYASYHLDGFRETGGEAALQINDLRLQRLESRAGVKIAGATNKDRWSVVPQLQADYVRVIGGANDGIMVSFAKAGEHTFVLPVANGDNEWAELKGGLKLVKGRLAIGAGFDTAVGRSDRRDDRAVADVTIRF